MNKNIGALEGGQSLDHFHKNLKRRVFKLKGLNRRSKTGVYATVEYGKEDWFHSDFDESVFPVDRQYALFNMFKDTEENLWSGKNHKVVVEFERLSSDGCPIFPIITEIILDL